MIQVGNEYLFVCKHYNYGDPTIDDLIVIAKNNNLKCTVRRYSKDDCYGRLYEITGSCGDELVVFEDELLAVQQ